MPADIVNGQLDFINGTRQFESVIQYECDPGYVLVGRSQLMCDVDQRWNGPPPRYSLFSNVNYFFIQKNTYFLPKCYKLFIFQLTLTKRTKGFNLFDVSLWKKLFDFLKYRLCLNILYYFYISLS